MDDGLDILIANLRNLKGAAFWQQLAVIASRPEFKQVEESTYSVIGPETPDYDRQLDAARKAVLFGYTVYLLPNPKAVKSADFIFQRKGVYKLFELKTITGQNSVGNRIMDALDQSNRLLLNMCTKYNPRKLGQEIIKCFKSHDECREVLIFHNKRAFSITRQTALQKGFGARFCRLYGK